MEISVKIDTKGALLSGKAPQIIQQGLDGFVTEATMFLLAEVKKRTPQGVGGAQSGLLGSIQSEVIGKGTPVVKGIVATSHEYGEVIEKGRRPGKGIPQKVEEAYTMVPWIMKKLGMGEKEAIKIEYVIRRSIKRKGFKGAHMFEKSVTENQSKLDAMATRHGLKIATELS